MRCDEEMHIVVREREDMVLYYKQLVTSLQSALEERRLGNTCLPSDPACHILQRHSPFDCANFKQHYIQGEMHMLSAKLLRNEHLLSQASKLSDKLQHALESKSEAADAIEPDELLLHDQVTQELDQAGIDVANFGDLLAVEAVISDNAADDDVDSIDHAD